MKKLSVIGALLLTMVMATGCGSKVMTSKNGMTVETPESGWKVQENDAGTYILTKKNDSIMCMTGESSEIKLPTTSEEAQAQVGEGGKILEFTYNDSDDKKSVYYVASITSDNSTTLLISRSEVKGNKYTTAVGTALNPTEERKAELKDAINNIEFWKN